MRLVERSGDIKRRPYREVIRSAAGKGGRMNPAFGQFQPTPPHDPIQFGDLATGMEAAATGYDLIMAREILQASAITGPLIGIAHEDGRMGWIMHLHHIDMMLHRCRLPPPPEAGQIQMHPNHTKANAANVEGCHHRAARFEAWQMDHIRVNMLLIAPDEEGIAVPSHALQSGGKLNGAVIRIHLQQTIGQNCVTDAEPPIRLLQRDDVGIELVKHVDGPLGQSAPIRT